MPVLLQLLILVALGWVGYRIYQSATGGSAPASRFKCATCKNCGALFDDGVLCRYGAKETFKNETHIANCQDYVRGRAG